MKLRETRPAQIPGALAFCRRDVVKAGTGSPNLAVRESLQGHALVPPAPGNDQRVRSPRAEVHFGSVDTKAGMREVGDARFRARAEAYLHRVHVPAPGSLIPFDLPDSMKVIKVFLTTKGEAYMNKAFLGPFTSENLTRTVFAGHRGYSR